MTQLVQLQKIATELADNGLTVFAISNDPVDVLADFAAQHDITYPLLSDEDSAVIRSFGIMNQLIEPGDGKSMRWYGIPYPGTYFVDGAGIVTDKDFHQHHARRASGTAVLARALGRPIEVEPQTVTEAATQDVNIRVGLADPALQLELLTQLVVQVDIPAGKHVYAPGAPEAFTPLSIEVSGYGIRVSEPIWPDPTPLTMTELDLTAPTYEGQLKVSVPITITSEAARLGHELAADSAELSIAIQFQTCDELACDLPQTLESTMTVPVKRLVEPDGLAIYAQRVEAAEANHSEYRAAGRGNETTPDC